jgi:uncharacterized protein (TIGR03118 family)
MRNFHKAACGGCFAALIALASAAPAQSAPMPTYFDQHNLVSDGSVTAAHTDPNLVNGWGVAFNPTGPAWVADNHTGLSTLYDGNGTVQPLVVQIPGANGAPGAPTGTVFNGSRQFAVTANGVTAAAAFLFAGEDGIISGWAPTVDGTHAIVAVDNSAHDAIYKGIAISADGSGIRLYASDFHNGKVDVFDGSFAPVATGGFVDPAIPAHYAPFGLQAIGGDIYVTYARQDANAEDDVAGRGLGFVDVYDPAGKLLRRLVRHGALNAPWGLAVAPAGFGRFAGRLLVGNFGDGHINAYDIGTGIWVGQLQSAPGKAIRIDGLWGLSFGNGFDSQPVDSLFFAAGPNGENGGLYGRLDLKSRAR